MNKFSQFFFGTKLRTVLSIIVIIVILIFLVNLFPGYFKGGGVSKGYLSERHTVSLEKEDMSNASMRPKLSETSERKEEAFSGESATPLEAPDRKMIMTAQLSLEVENFQAAYNKALSAVMFYQGFLSESNISSSEDTPKNGVFVFKVPNKEFIKTTEELSKLGKIRTKNIRGEDVTEEYVDLQARERNLKRTEFRMQQILNMAKTVPEVLNVEREINRIHGELEEVQGKIRYLNNKTELATISLELFEKDSAKKPQGFWKSVWTELKSNIKDAIKGSVLTLVWAVNFLVRVAIFLIVVIIPVGVIILILRNLYRHYFKK